MKGPEFHGEVSNILSDRKETLTVDLLENLHVQRKFVIRLAHEIDDDPFAVTYADLCPDNTRSLGDLLHNAADVAEFAEPERMAGLIGVRPLPVICLCGTEFFIDERLRQLRNVGNPMHFFELEDRTKT